MNRWINLALAGLVVSCGFDLRVRPSDEEAKPKTENQEFVSQEITLNLTADYELPPVDVLVIQEHHNHFRNNNLPFRGPLYASQSVPTAYDHLAVRLFNSGLDFQLGAINSTANNINDATTNTGALLDDGAGGNQILTAEGFNFFTDALTVLTPTFDRNESYPFTAIKGLLDRSAQGGAEGDFLREDAKLAVLYVGVLDEVNEVHSANAMIEMLDNAKGAGNWRFSGMIPDKNGCSFRDNNGTLRNTNDIYTGADSSLWDAYPRQNRIHEVIEKSGGVLTSICSESYIDLIEDFMKQGTSLGFFEVSLDEYPDPDSIEVVMNGFAVEGWRYDAESNVMMIPTTIRPGMDFTVSFRTVEDLVEGLFEDDFIYEEISQIEEVALSPAEIAFFDEIQDVMIRNCTGCHNQYSDFDATWNNRVNIEMRIQLPETDPLSMPQNTTFAMPDDMSKILNWISTYGG